MRKLSNTKETIRVVTSKEHPIKPFCTNPSKIDEYAPQPKTPKPVFIRGAEPRHIVNRYAENSHNITYHHGQQLIMNNMISNHQRSRAKTNWKLKEKYEYHTKIYGSKKEGRVGYAAPVP
jgi:hypothetical protein